MSKFKFALALVLLTGCIGRGIFISRSEIEQFACIKFPQSTRHLQTYAERGLDMSLMIRFEIDSVDLEPFLKDSGFDLPLKAGYRPFEDFLGPKFEWWTPEQARFVAGGDDYSTRVVRKIMVDLTSTDIIIVFITADRI